MYDTDILENIANELEDTESDYTFVEDEEEVTEERDCRELEDIQEMHIMIMGEEASYRGTEYYILRIPMGWIITQSHNNTSVFVPENNMFAGIRTT